jgi:hypothetical protein
MTLDPTLIDTVNANLPNLDVPDLAALRAAALQGHAHRCARRSLSPCSQKQLTRSDSGAARTSACHARVRWARALDHAQSSARVLASVRPVMGDNDWAAESVSP